MTSEKGENLQLNVRVKECEALEFGKEYSLPSDPADMKFFSNGKITVSVGDGELERYYYATDGWLLIESVESLRDDGNAPHVVNGSFEFTAKEEFSGDVINVSNGTFHRTFFTSPGMLHVSNW